MGQSAATQRKKKGIAEPVDTSRQKYADYLVYWPGETDAWVSPLPAAARVTAGATGATKASGEQFMALLSNKDLCGLIVAQLDVATRLALRLSCRAARRVHAMPEGVLDLSELPVLLQGLRLAQLTAPWPVRELVVDQMVLRMPGGLEGMERILRAHSSTLVRLQVYAAPWWRYCTVSETVCV
jgi:hypothetical protein